MTKAPTTTGREMRYHRLDDFIALHGSKLPQIVKVGEGFQGTSVDQSVETGEVLIIFKVEREKKILARQVSSGRGLCFSRTCDLKVEMLITDPSRDEFSTLDTIVELPSRYVRVLENITSFGLLAGDVLQLSRERPYSNRCDVRCLLVSLKDPVYVDLPASVEGKFQALSKYGIFSIDEVLNESALPVKVRVVALEQTTANNVSKHATPLPIDKIGNIHLERKIEGDTVFAISLRKENSVLMFPSTLDISVAQFMPHQDFLSCSGAEYKQLVNAIENDKGLHNKLSEDCVYFTSDPVKRYYLEQLQFVSFPFARKQRVVTTGRRAARAETQDHFCLGLHSTAQKQQATFKSDGIQPHSFSENEAPPLPPKMTLIATQCHVSSKEDQVHDTESKQESEKQWDSFEIHGQQEAPTCCLQNDLNDHGLFWPHDQSRENTLLQPGSKQKDVTSKMHVFGDNFSESEKAASHSKRTAYEPEVDVNANLSLVAGVHTDSKPKQSLVEFLQPTQTPCHLSRSLPGITSEIADEVQGRHLPRKPLFSMENDLNQDLTTETSEKTTKREQHGIQKCDRSSPEQSDEIEENSNKDNLDLSYPEEVSDDYASNVEYGCQGCVENADRVPQEELKSPEGSSDGEFSRANVENPKKKFFHSLTRKPRWFRQDASKSAKKDKGQVLKTKSKSMKIPPRLAASCEGILISSPREDDFECIRSITKYLETQEKLTKALVHISRLESQGLTNVETAPTSESNEELANGQENSTNESGKGWPKNEREVDTQDSQIPDKALPFTPANTPEEPEASGLPVPHYFGFRHRSRAWQHQNPLGHGDSDPRRGETNTERHGMPNDGHTWAASKMNDSESVVPLGCSSPSDNGRGSGRRESDDRELHQEEFNKTCPCCQNYFTDAFGEELSESKAKNNLKKAILQMNWSEDEWMELTEVVRRKRTEAGCVHVPYVNLALSHERPTTFSTDLATAVDSSYPKSNGEMSRRVGMPPYENLNRESARSATLPYENIAGDTSQASRYNDVQRLASRSQGKPPIPTPRSERPSI